MNDEKARAIEALEAAVIEFCAHQQFDDAPMFAERMQQAAKNLERLGLPSGRIDEIVSEAIQKWQERTNGSQ